jgi:hypothetical protein
MKRRELLQHSAALGWIAAFPMSARAASVLGGDATPMPLVPPSRAVPVAFLVSDGAVVIDFCGPWEVFQDAIVRGPDADAFRLYTVAETTRPITASGGLKIVPDYSFEKAPVPKVIVIPAQGGHTEKPSTGSGGLEDDRRHDVGLSPCDPPVSH